MLLQAPPLLEPGVVFRGDASKAMVVMLRALRAALSRSNMSSTPFVPYYMKPPCQFSCEKGQSR